MRLPPPARLMFLVFRGLVISLAYGLLGTAALNWVTGSHAAKEFLIAYIGPFNTLASLGLALVTALIVARTQNLIPDAIEAAFSEDELALTSYREQKERFNSLRRNVIFTAMCAAIGFLIFHFCSFPFSGPAEVLMMSAAVAQWALGGYIGRKLRYAGMMLYALFDVNVHRNLFKERELDAINTYVHLVSTLAVIFIYVHVRGYYYAPFRYDRYIGESAQVFLLLPAILATPVALMFNFFPREVLQTIYDTSIDVEMRRLQATLRNDSITDAEKQLRVMTFSKMWRDEMRYSLKLTLGDLPISLAVLVMVLQPLIKR
jgi:hypothetical protein